MQDYSGRWFALSAFTIWGLFPFYFKLIDHISPLEILANRVIWSALLLIVIVLFLKQWRRILSIIANLSQHKYLLFTAILIGSNWGCYVWAVNNNYIFEASLGYYINPLLNIFLGYVFLSERLRPAQWFAVVLAIIGVVIETWIYGKLPWVALILSGMFSLYGLFHKKLKLDSVSGLTVEALLLIPLALLFLFQLDPSTAGPFQWSVKDYLILAASGPITVIPLLLFTGAAKRIPLSELGFIQYVTPTILFLLAIFVFDQGYTMAKLITFMFIWCALIIVSVDAIKHHKNEKLNNVS